MPATVVSASDSSKRRSRELSERLGSIIRYNFLAALWKHRELIFQLTRRDVVGRYRGSVMGLLWSLFHPILMLVVYTVVFSVVFEVKWGTVHESRVDFAIILFAGLLVHALLSEPLARAPTVVLGNVNFVKKIVFPLEVLPLVAVGSALFHTFVNVAVLLLFLAGSGGSVSVTALWLPVVLLPLVLMSAGLSWFLASLGVYLRDVSHIVGIATTALLFLSPVFYPVSALPEHLRDWLYLNPLTFVIEQCRDVLIWGASPDWLGLGVYALVSVVVAGLGLIWFQRTRPGFADVL